jgi:hypothetical protein
MSWIVVVSTFGLALGLLVTWTSARGQRWRWGWRAGGQAEVGEGAYRSASVVVREPRRMPVIFAIASVTSVVWGTMMMFVFAPAGLLLFIVLAPFVGHGLAVLLGAVGMIGATLHGFGLGWRLIRVVTPLTVRTPSSEESIQRIIIATVAHHGLVVASFALICAGAAEWEWFWLAWLPCSIGLAQAGLLVRARSALVRIDREDRALAAG